MQGAAPGTSERDRLAKASAANSKGGNDPCSSTRSSSSSSSGSLSSRGRRHAAVDVDVWIPDVGTRQGMHRVAGMLAADSHSSNAAHLIASCAVGGRMLPGMASAEAEPHRRCAGGGRRRAAARHAAGVHAWGGAALSLRGTFRPRSRAACGPHHQGQHGDCNCMCILLCGAVLFAGVFGAVFLELPACQQPHEGCG